MFSVKIRNTSKLSKIKQRLELLLLMMQLFSSSTVTCHLEELEQVVMVAITGSRVLKDLATQEAFVKLDP